MPPKVIHQIVGPKKNDLIHACMFSWNFLKTYGFDILIWDDNRIAVFIKKYYPFATAAFLTARNYAEAADIARYLIVYHFGGYYMDWDIQLLNAKDFISIARAHPNGYLVIDPVNDTLASECFSAKEKEPFLLSLSEDIVAIYNSGQRDLMLTPQYSGPYRMRDSLHKHKNSKQSLIPVEDIFLYNYWEIRNKPQKNDQRPLIHYWVHNWLRQ
jgi:hypothetical protein